MSGHPTRSLCGDRSGWNVAGHTTYYDRRRMRYQCRWPEVRKRVSISETVSTEYDLQPTFITANWAVTCEPASGHDARHSQVGTECTKRAANLIEVVPVYRDERTALAWPNDGIHYVYDGIKIAEAVCRCRNSVKCKPHAHSTWTRARWQ